MIESSIHAAQAGGDRGSASVRALDVARVEVVVPEDAAPHGLQKMVRSFTPKLVERLRDDLVRGPVAAAGTVVRRQLARTLALERRRRSSRLFVLDHHVLLPGAAGVESPGTSSRRRRGPSGGGHLAAEPVEPMNTHTPRAATRRTSSAIIPSRARRPRHRAGDPPRARQARARGRGRAFADARSPACVRLSTQRLHRAEREPPLIP